MIHCGLCIRSFGDLRALNQHLKNLSQHVSCKRCQRGFNSGLALKCHLDTSHEHESHGQSTQNVSEETRPPNLCVQTTPSRLIEPSTSQTVVVALDSSHDYTGIPRSEVDIVFKVALKIRSQQPSPDMIIERTQTKLGRDIVCALIDATYRLLPIDKSLEGGKARRQKQLERTKEALSAEQNFRTPFTELGYQFLDELQQRQRQVHAFTPDILFSRPTLVNGTSVPVARIQGLLWLSRQPIRRLP